MEKKQWTALSLEVMHVSETKCKLRPRFGAVSTSTARLRSTSPRPSIRSRTAPPTR